MRFLLLAFGNEWKLKQKNLLKNLFALLWQGGIVGTMNGNCIFYDIIGMPVFGLISTLSLPILQIQFSRSTKSLAFLQVKNLYCFGSSSYLKPCELMITLLDEMGNCGSFRYTIFYLFFSSQYYNKHPHIYFFKYDDEHTACSWVRMCCNYIVCCNWFYVKNDHACGVFFSYFYDFLHFHIAV